jgi:hypothetical protein
MAESVTFRNSLLDCVAAGYRWFSLHTADPGTTGANQVGTREQITWDVSTGGSKPGVAPVSIDVAPATTVTHWGLWTAEVGGSFGKGGALPNPETYTGAGVYNLSATLTA